MGIGNEPELRDCVPFFVQELMKFIPGIRRLPPEAEIVYVPGEFSVDTVPSLESTASLLVNDVQLGLDVHGMLVSVWGLCPFPERAERRPLRLRAPSATGVCVVGPEIRPGISYRLHENRLPMALDAESGWVLVGSTSADSSHAYLSPFRGVVLQLDSGGNFVGLWLRPKYRELG